MNPGRPHADEYLPYFGRYIDLVPDGDILSLLSAQREATHACLASLDRDNVLARPTPEDWNILEVLGHITDTEHVFAHRALHIARGDSAPLPSFEQDGYVLIGRFAERSLDELLSTFSAVRQATVALCRTFDADAWNRIGIASGHASTPRAWAYTIAGHERHHMADFAARYGVQTDM